MKWFTGVLALLHGIKFLSITLICQKYLDVLFYQSVLWYVTVSSVEHAAVKREGCRFELYSVS